MLMKHLFKLPVFQCEIPAPGEEVGCVLSWSHVADIWHFLDGNLGWAQSLPRFFLGHKGCLLPNQRRGAFYFGCLPHEPKPQNQGGQVFFLVIFSVSLGKGSRCKLHKPVLAHVLIFLPSVASTRGSPWCTLQQEAVQARQDRDWESLILIVLTLLLGCLEV